MTMSIEPVKQPPNVQRNRDVVKLLRQMGLRSASGVQRPMLAGLGS